MWTKLLLIITILLLVGCNRNKNRMVRDLTNNNYKYWYRYHKDTAKPYSLGFCINRDGTYISYYKDNNDRETRVIYRSPMLPEPVWKIIDDSTIMFGKGDLYRILSFNQDSIILQSKAFDGYLKLKKDADRQTKPIVKSEVENHW